MTNYNKYILSKKEYVSYGMLGISILGVFSYFFYNSYIPTLLLLPTLKFYFKFVQSYLFKKRKNKLLLQFKDAISSMSSSLNSGNSFEHAVWDAYLEIRCLYSANCYMAIELDAICKKLRLSIPVEEAFNDFALRADIDDVSTFCEILSLAKRGGGNIISIINTSIVTICEKIDIHRDITTKIAAKKFEHNIMCFMPMLIMLYLDTTSDGFFIPLYHNIPGIIFMTICLVIYVSAIFIAHKIIHITF